MIRVWLPEDEAIARFREWVPWRELEPPAGGLDSGAAYDRASTGKGWRGVPFHVLGRSDWTDIRPISCSLRRTPTDRWLQLAARDKLLFTDFYGPGGFSELILIEGGRVKREFRKSVLHPKSDVDTGRLPFEEKSPLATWEDVGDFVYYYFRRDADLPDLGTLLLYEDTGETQRITHWLVNGKRPRRPDRR